MCDRIERKAAQITVVPDARAGTAGGNTSRPILGGRASRGGRHYADESSRRQPGYSDTLLNSPIVRTRGSPTAHSPEKKMT